MCTSNQFSKVLNFNNHPMFWQKVLNENELKFDKWIKFEILKCKKCGLVQARYKKQNNDYYNDDYLCCTWKENWEYQKKMVNAIIEEYWLKNKKAIEIWCWDWVFSKELMSKWVDMYAIEPSGKAYEKAKKTWIKVERKNIKDVNKKFDFFILRQVLEHIENPNIFLGEIVSIMKGEFNWIIEIPRLEYLYEKNRIFEFYPEHLAYYDLVTLANLLWNFFFIDSIEKSFDWQYLLAKVSNKKMNLDIEMKDIKQLDKIINKYKPWEIIMRWAWAKWINILSLLSNYKAIGTIIDSDINKWRKYTPATHIQIQNKDILKNNTKIKAIIIASDMYKKEIVLELLTKYNFKNDIIFISWKATSSPEVKRFTSIKEIEKW